MNKFVTGDVINRLQKFVGRRNTAEVREEIINELINKKVLNYSTVDSDRLMPEPELIGLVYKHFKGNYYTVVGIEWDAERDLWLYAYLPEYKNENDIPCSRSITNFFEEVSPGVKRFTLDRREKS